MSLNLGSKQISPIQIDNVINNQSNKTVTPSIYSQTITQDKIHILCNNLTDSDTTMSGTGVGIILTTNYLNIFPTLYARVNGRAVLNWTGVNSMTCTFNNAILNISGRQFNINPNGTTIILSGATSNWNNYDVSFKIYKYGNQNLRIGYSLDSQCNNVSLYVYDLTVELSDDPTFSNNYDGMDQVTIEPIPSDYIIPEGTLTISAPGVVNAASYASVSIPGMANPTWNTTTITSNTGKINYSINLTSGFKSTSQIFTSSYTLPSVAGTTITPTTAAQTAVAQYKWTTGSVIVGAIPVSIGVYKKIIERTVTIPELNSFFSSQTTAPSYAFIGATNLDGSVNGVLNFSNVTNIGSSAFSGCTKLTHISGPNVTTLENCAFYGCSSLTTANFPNAITIRTSAFYGCSSLTTANFPNATNIEGYAFAYCFSLTTASFPNATSIGNYAFRNCSALTTASFPNATSIGNYAFRNCSALTTASFPNATNIEGYAFFNCSSLTTASFPSATSIGNYAFAGCRSLTTISFPNATTIGTYAFNNCYALTTADFPSATSIRSYAFYICSKLSSLYLTGSSVASLINTNAFSSTPMSSSGLLGYFGSIYVPTSLLASYKAATNWSLFSDRFVGV